jgi:hypothetical protein
MDLIGKSHLHWLTLNWNEHTVGDAGEELEKDDIILHDISLHSNIKVLEIYGYGGVTFSSSNSHCCMSNASACLICLVSSA